MYNIGQIVETINGVGQVVDYHSETGQYQVDVDGAFGWYHTDEISPLNECDEHHYSLR